MFGLIRNIVLQTILYNAQCTYDFVEGIDNRIYRSRIYNYKCEQLRGKDTPGVMI